MDWIQQWQSKLNKQNGVAPLVRTGGSRHTGLAALPYRNIQKLLCPGFYDGFSHRFEAILPFYKMQSNEFLSDLSILYNNSNDYHYYFYRESAPFLF